MGWSWWVKGPILGLAAIVVSIIIVAASGDGDNGAVSYSDDECAYLDTVQGQAEVFSGALDELGILLPQVNLTSEKWIFDVAAQLVMIQLTADEVDALVAPPALARVHGVYERGAGDLREATLLITQGIDELDVDVLLEATTRMENGGYAMIEAGSRTRAFRTTRSGSC